MLSLTRPRQWCETAEEYDTYLKKRPRQEYPRVTFSTILSDSELDRLWGHFNNSIVRYADKEHPFKENSTVCWMVCPELNINFEYTSKLRFYFSIDRSWMPDVSDCLTSIWNKFLHAAEDWLLTNREIPFPKKSINPWKRWYREELREYTPWGDMFRNGPIPGLRNYWKSSYEWTHEYKDYSSRGEFVYYKFLYKYRDDKTGKIKSRYKGSKSRFKKSKYDGDYFDRRITASDDDWKDQMDELKHDEYQDDSELEQDWWDRYQDFLYDSEHPEDFEFYQRDLRKKRYFGMPNYPVGYCYHGPVHPRNN